MLLFNFYFIFIQVFGIFAVSSEYTPSLAVKNIEASFLFFARFCVYSQ